MSTAPALITIEARDDAQTRRTVEGLHLVAIERAAIETALGLAENSIVEASKLLGITRHALRRRLMKHGIRVSVWAGKERA